MSQRSAPFDHTLVREILPEVILAAGIEGSGRPLRAGIPIDRPEDGPKRSRLFLCRIRRKPVHGRIEGGKNSVQMPQL
jgi:hypothetical protein